MKSEDQVFKVIYEAIEPFKGYKQALVSLAEMPRGFRLCFAFHYTNADISNGGISQLHSNSTWPLILQASAACNEAQERTLERVLKEAVLYYHQRGRSRLQRSLTQDFFVGIEQPMNKKLSDLDSEFYGLAAERAQVIPALLKKESLWE